jgi:hypothetical protein
MQFRGRGSPAAIIAAVRRPFFVEVFAIANLILVAVLTRDSRLEAPSIGWLVSFAVSFALQALAGIGVRSVVALVRGDRGYFRVIRSRRWILDTLLLVLLSALVVYVYAWIKLFVPVLNPRLFDAELWELDRLLFFGLAPTVFFLDLFGNAAFLRAIDWSYAWIFIASTAVASAFFLSHPSRRIRVAFANGNGLLWIAGGWLYVLVPSYGPAYRFSDIWFAYGASLGRTQFLQGLLMRNYQDVLRAARGEPHGPINLVMGIAAFPSLHVAYQFFVFFWMRRLWKSGEVLFGIFAAAICLGSMITGWHYLIDALAGVLLAFACHAIFWRRARMSRWLRLF